jgi:hypothetical protein
METYGWMNGRATILAAGAGPVTVGSLYCSSSNSNIDSAEAAIASSSTKKAIAFDIFLQDQAK